MPNAFTPGSSPQGRFRQTPGNTAHFVYPFQTEVPAAVTAWTLKLPPVMVGHTLIAYLVSDRNTVTTVTPPAGWLLIPGTQNGIQNSDAALDDIGWFYYKAIRAGDPELTAATVTFTHASASAGQAIIARVTDAHSTQPINAAASTGGLLVSSHTTPSITPTVDGCRVISFMGVDKTSSTSPNNYWTPPAGWSEIVDLEERVNFVSIGVATTRNAVAGTAVTGTWTSTDSESAIMLVVALNPPETIIGDRAAEPGTSFHPGGKPGTRFRFIPQTLSYDVAAAAGGVGGGALVISRTQTSSAASKQAAGSASTVQRDVTVAAGVKAAAGSSASVQRTAVTATGSKGGVGTGAPTQRTSTADTTRKQAIATGASTARTDTTDSIGKQGAGTGVASARQATTSASTPIIGGAGLVISRTATTSSGTVGSVGTSLPAHGTVTAREVSSVTTPNSGTATPRRDVPVTAPPTSRVSTPNGSGVTHS
jgi:hypothetical protein